jgi:RNA polymerase sigma factor (sigma-70 family)
MLAQLQLPPPARPPDPWAVALAYLPLVEQVARGFRVGRFDRDDLIQEGLIGVRNAALRFDRKRGTFRGLAWVAARNRMLAWVQWRDRDRRATGDVNHALARTNRIDGEALADVLAALSLRTDWQQTVVREHFGLYGPARTEAAIAVAMGTTWNAVARAQFRALVKVRKRLGVAS